MGYKPCLDILRFCCKCEYSVCQVAKGWRVLPVNAVSLLCKDPCRQFLCRSYIPLTERRICYKGVENCGCPGYGFRDEVCLEDQLVQVSLGNDPVVPAIPCNDYRMNGDDLVSLE